VINAPNPVGQTLAITRALISSDTDPRSVKWIIAHGTGAPRGDLAEATALAAAYPGPSRWLTSNKTQTGHGAAAAGVLSVIHALLALDRGLIPAQRNYDHPAPGLPCRGPLVVPTQHVPWPDASGSPIAAVNSCGAGGTNVHVLIAADARACRAAPAAITTRNTEPLAIAAWGADLPGRQSLSEIADWLYRRGCAPPLSYAPGYPPATAREFLMPPASLRATDSTQICALRLFRDLTEPLEAGLRDLSSTTGVFANHCGPTPNYARNTMRCYLDALRHAHDITPADPADELWKQIAGRVRGAIVPVNAYSHMGTLTNAIAARVAHHFNLRGPAMAVDAGLGSGLAALRVAYLYLASGAIDVAFIVAINIGGPEIAELTTNLAPEQCALADGGFALLVTRTSLATSLRWPVLAELRTIPRPQYGAPLNRPRALDGRSYLGADSLITLIHALRLGR
jgi:acyl transferase domain-containing protein